MAKLAILGHGVVGSGVAELLDKNADTIAKHALEPVAVKRILDLRSFPDLPYADKFTTDFKDISEDDEITIVAEMMGGVHPAYEFVSECLQKGKSVVTSNKELVAEKGAELLKMAAEHHVNFLFEASVGGGIPVIHPLHKCLCGNHIQSIMGILNGTTNFILTKMITDKMSFEDALALAQKLGYAERDPSADVDGHDACRKICILASLAYGNHVYPASVHTEGIRGVAAADVEYAKNWGGVIKLIGAVHPLENGKLSIIVCPMLIPNACPLSNVTDVFNSVLVNGDATGDVMFYGKGAGKLPTASAVVGDIIDAVKHHDTIPTLYWEDTGKDVVEEFSKTSSAFYYRVETNGTLPNDVTVLTRDNAPANEAAFVTLVMTEAQAEAMEAKWTSQGIRVLSKLRIAALGE